MVNKIKTALRITHNYLDDDIANTIATARLELIRMGVAIDVANDETDELVNMAIKTYCLGVYATNERMMEGFQKSFEVQADSLRKSAGYSNV